MLLRLALIACGGALGACSRYLTQTVAIQLFGNLFPYGTLTANTLGSFIIGLLIPIILRHPIYSDALTALFITGFLGAYTTFSTFAIDTITLSNASGFSMGTLNVALNVVLALLFVYLGTILAELL